MAEPKLPPKRATYKDILDAPEHKVAEIIDGELIMSPRPGGPHSSVSSNLGGELVPAFGRGRGGPGGWIILDEPELHLGTDVLVPDLGGWRRERMPNITMETVYFEVPPDWVCEVLSPSTEKIDRSRKLRIYGASGVPHVWLAHPGNRTLEVFRRREGIWDLIGIYADGDKTKIEPFDAIELDLAMLWADLPPLPPPTRASEDGPIVWDLSK